MANKPVKIKYPYQEPEGYFEHFPHKLEKWMSTKKQVRNHNKRYVLMTVGMAASFLILVLTVVLSIDYLQTKKENKSKKSVVSDNKTTENDVTQDILITEEEIPLEEVLINMSEQELTQWTEVYLIDMFYQTPL